MTAERDAGETSWQRVSDWYDRLVGREGSYYHRQVILPHSLKLLDLRKDSSLLELACGQGVLARYLPEGVYYQGVDSAPDLLEQARRLDKNQKHRYTLADASKPLPIPKKDFTHAVIILALQNIPDAEGVVRNPREHLKRGGRLLVVLNHPCFRIPRQSSWGIDLQNQLQYRRIDRYLSPQEIPIRIHPGRGARSESAWSYHLPLSEYSRLLYQNGFVIERIEEWVSDKESQGKAAKMENRARREFPLFLALLARRE